MQVFSRKTKVKYRHFSRKTKVKKYGFGRKTKVLLSSTTALDIAFATLLKNSLSIKLIAPISMNHPRRGGFFFTISSAAGAAGELKQHKKEPSDFDPIRFAVEEVIAFFLQRVMLDGN